MDLTHLKRHLEDAKRSSKRISAPRTAILWGQKDLLGEAVEALLTAQSGWQAFRIFDERGITALKQEVEQVHPDIVVVNQCNIVSDIQPLLRLIQGYPELKIITINLENNLVEVFDKHTIQIKEKSDLLTIIGEQCSSMQEGGDPERSKID